MLLLPAWLLVKLVHLLFVNEVPRLLRLFEKAIDPFLWSMAALLALAPRLLSDLE